MEQHNIIELINKYERGDATNAEILLIEKMIEQGKIDFDSFPSLIKLDETINRKADPSPSIDLDHRFYEMLASEKSKSKIVSFSIPEWSLLFPRLALACSILLVGFLGGYWFHKPTENSEVKQLTQQVEGLKEMMMISLLEKESATERLKAVSLTQDINGPSTKVTAALLKTLNADPNINVRLAALDALQGYSNLSMVREGLVRSISQQDSPLVQVALAELMVAIQEKSSVKELKKVLANENTPKEVKERIKKSIDVLI